MRSIAEEVFDRIPPVFEMVLANLSPVDRITFCYTFGKEEYIENDEIFLLMLEAIKSTDQLLCRFKRRTEVLNKNLSVTRKWMDEGEKKQKKRRFF